MRLTELEDHQMYDDEELELIFGEYLNNTIPIKYYFEKERIPLKYRLMPKSKIVYRGIFLSKEKLSNITKISPVKLSSKRYESFSTSPSVALEFAQGNNYNYATSTKLRYRDQKSEHNTMGVCIRKNSDSR